MVERTELEKLLINGLRARSAEVEKYPFGSREYLNARRIFIVLFEYMDIHNDFIPEEYRQFYKRLRDD